MKAIFLDRDGVINYLVERMGGQKTAPWTYEEFKLVPGIVSACQDLTDAEYALFVCTNQPDTECGKGPLTYSELAKMHIMIKNLIEIKEIISCEDRNSSSYKPNNGMIEYLIDKYKVDRTKSYMIGDTWKDIVAGNKSQLKTILIGNDYEYPYQYKDIKPDFIVNDIIDAVKAIEGAK